jgi:hypothetical protein
MPEKIAYFVFASKKKYFAKGTSFDIYIYKKYFPSK